MKTFNPFLLATSLVLLSPLISNASTLPTVEKSAVIGLSGYVSQIEMQKVCTTVQDSIAAWSMSTVPNAKCVVLSGRTVDQLEQDIKASASAAQTGFIITLTKDSVGHQTHVLLRSLVTTDASEPVNLKWSVKESKDELASIQKIIQNYAEFDAKKTQLKFQLLQHGITESKLIGLNTQNVVVSKATQKPISFNEAYTTFLNESAVHKNYLAAGLEIAAVLSASVVDYYLPSAVDNANARDWEYGSRDSVRARFVTGDALRFDDNHFRTNRGHYFAGVVYYEIARSSGLSRLESFLVTAASSSLWEYFGEYREVVSINDQINTTFGGFIIGEALHQMGKIFEKGGNTGLNRILKGVFHSPRQLSNWVQRKTTSDQFEDIPSKPDVWAKLDLYAGTSSISGGGSTKTVGFDGEVIALPLFEEAGQAHQLVMDETVYSQLKLEKSLGGNYDSFMMFAKTTLAAYYDKNLGRTADGKLNGYNLFVGPSMALEINQQTPKEGSSAQNDFRGVAHIIGGTIDMTGYYKGFRLRCVVDVYGDFAMIRSYAFDSYRAQNDVSRTQSVLRNEDYYYGLGHTQNLKLIIAKDKLEIGAQAQQTKASIINQRSRFGSTETTDLDAVDDVTSGQLWVAYQLNADVRIELGAEKILRSGAVNELSVNAKEVKKYGKLIYSYK